MLAAIAEDGLVLLVDVLDGEEGLSHHPLKNNQGRDRECAWAEPSGRHEEFDGRMAF